jgi:hypothetical protein
MSISPPQPVKLGQRLPKVLCVLPPKIRLLHPPTPAPYPPLRGRPINNGVLVQDLIVRRHDETTRANDAVRRNPHSVVHARSRRNRVEVAHARRLDS